MQHHEPRGNRVYTTPKTMLSISRRWPAYPCMILLHLDCGTSFGIAYIKDERCEL
jgi:hypothetical protein